MRSNRWTASTTALRKAQVRKKLLLGNSSAGLRYNVKLLYITQSPSPIAKNLSVVPSLAWHLAGILPSKAREGGGKGENWPMNMHGDMMGNREGGGDSWRQTRCQSSRPRTLRGECGLPQTSQPFSKHLRSTSLAEDELVMGRRVGMRGKICAPLRRDLSSSLQPAAFSKRTYPFPQMESRVFLSPPDPAREGLTLSLRKLGR